MTKLGSGLVCTALVLMYLSYTTAQLQNIYDVAKKGGLTTLVTALDVAGLDGVFKKNGTYTVFAPTNEAFKKLPAGALDNLLKMPEHLSEVLRYHVLPALVQSSMIVNGTKADTLLPNSSIHITIDSNGRVMINNAAVVTTADVQASNGVVHIIDTVLMPPMPSTERKAEPEPSSEPKAEPHSEPEPEYEPEPESEPKPVMPNPRTAARTYDDEDFSGESSGYSSEEYDNMYNGSSILDVAMQSRLTTLVALIEQAGLTQALSAQGPFTIMAPHDDSGFGTFAMPELVNDPENLKILLSYHVIPGKVMASDLTDGMEANTLAGEMMMFHVSKAGVTLNGGASKVIKADVVASNGVIHIIDKVLVPEKLMKKVTE